MQRKLKRSCDRRNRKKALKVCMGLGVFALSLSSGYGARAFAGTVSGGGGSYILSGPAQTNVDVPINIQASSSLTVTTEPGFGINTSHIFDPDPHIDSTLHAIALRTTDGNIIFTDNNQSAVNSSHSGILATTGLSFTKNPPFYHYGQTGGGGDISITTSGPILAVDRGIYARTRMGNVTINASGPVQTSGINGLGGITAISNFGGSITINASDTVDSAAVGIRAFSSDYGMVHDGNISITTKNVYAGDTAIKADNFNNSKSLTVNTEGNLIVDGFAGNGVDLFNYGVDTTLHVTGNVSAKSEGIRIWNDKGKTSVVVQGDVSTIMADGINVQNNGTDLRIATRRVTGGMFGAGIKAENNGTGSLSITSTGPVTGGDSQLVVGVDRPGISAVNHGTDLLIDAEDVKGESNGITADNHGSGSLVVTSSGTVTGRNGTGISAINSDNGTLLQIDAHNVEGTTNAIEARNQGGGDLVIRTTGTVTGGPEKLGNGNAGIYAVNSGHGALNIDTGSGTVTGSTGITALNKGGGGVTLTSQGTIRATTASPTGTDPRGHTSGGRGINAINYQGDGDVNILVNNVSGGHGSAQNWMWDPAIKAQNLGTGNVNIDVGGEISGEYRSTGVYALIGEGVIPANSGGIRGIDNAVGKDININVGGPVHVGGFGIVAANGGTGSTTIHADSDVYGRWGGIYAVNNADGSLTITSNGSVTAGMQHLFDPYGGRGYGSGLKAFSSGTDMNIDIAGDVKGAAEGLQAELKDGDLNIHVGGKIHSYLQSGMIVKNNGNNTYINVNDVYGGMGGIKVGNFGTGDLVVTSAGEISSRWGSGIDATNYGRNTIIQVHDVLPNKSQQVGFAFSSDGIRVWHEGSGIAYIKTTGTILAKHPGPGPGPYQQVPNNGMDIGINVVNKGGGPTYIDVNQGSSVLGGTSGIYATSLTGQETYITIDGEVKNYSGLATDDAIVTKATPTTVNLNTDSVTTGLIRLGDLNDTVSQLGTLTGDLLLGGGDDQFVQIYQAPLSGYADGGVGNDTLGFGDMGDLYNDNNNGLLKYRNFENLAIIAAYTGVNPGYTGLHGQWDFTGNISVYDRGILNVAGGLTAGSLTVYEFGSMNMSGITTIAGETVTAGMFNIETGGSFTGDYLGIARSGTAAVSGDVEIAGDTIVWGDLDVQSGGSFTGNYLGIAENGTATVSGDAEIAGDTVVWGHLGVQSGGSITGNHLYIAESGATTVSGDADVAGDTVVWGNFDVQSGGSFASNTMTIDSEGFTQISGNADIQTYSSVFGTMSLDGSLTSPETAIESGGLLMGNGCTHR